MKLIMIYIELGYLLLQRPQDVGLYLRKIPRVSFYAVFIVIMSALSMAVGVYLMRDYSGQGYYAVLGCMTLGQSLYMGMAGLMSGVLLDFFVRRNAADRPSMPVEMAVSTCLGFLPLQLATPAALLAKLAAHSPLFFYPMLLLLLFWSMYIVMKIAQFVYEIPMRLAVRSTLAAFTFVGLFPMAFFLFLFFELLPLWP